MVSLQLVPKKKGYQPQWKEKRTGANTSRLYKRELGNPTTVTVNKLMPSLMTKVLVYDIYYSLAIKLHSFQLQTFIKVYHDDDFSFK